jgi:hypothetical protein
MVMPAGASAGGTPEDVKAFQENKAKAEATVGFGGYPDQSQAGQGVGASGKPPVENKAAKVDGTGASSVLSANQRSQLQQYQAAIYRLGG